MNQKTIKIFDYDWVENPENQHKRGNYIFENLEPNNNESRRNNLDINDVRNNKGNSDSDDASTYDLTQDDACTYDLTQDNEIIYDLTQDNENVYNLSQDNENVYESTQESDLIHNINSATGENRFQLAISECEFNENDREDMYYENGIIEYENNWD